MNPQEFPVIFWLGIKILTIVGLMIYSVFAFVMVRQEGLMADVLEEGFEPVLKILAYSHLALALLMLVLSFIIL